MFDKTRRDLVQRLGVLIDRFEIIQKRAADIDDEARFASRAGLSGQGTSALCDEISYKALDQASLCGQSIEALTLHGSFPLMFKKGTKKAESFADQCEEILNGINANRAAAKAAFRERFEQ